MTQKICGCLGALSNVYSQPQEAALHQVTKRGLPEVGLAGARNMKGPHGGLGEDVMYLHLAYLLHYSTMSIGHWSDISGGPLREWREKEARST
jgi:hypothetical protein